MIERHHVLGSREFPALAFFPSLILASSVPLGFAHGNIGHALPAVFGLISISAVTFIMWRYRRRDYASPRRNGRRI